MSFEKFGMLSVNAEKDEKSDEERLSQEEAILYQVYATEIEGKGINEQASEESYAEAEKLLARLKEKNFDWLKIDWNQIDFKNVEHVKDIEGRLDVAIKQMVVDGKDETGAFSKLVNRFRNTTIPIALAVLALCGSVPMSVNAAESSMGMDTVATTTEHRNETRGERFRMTNGEYYVFFEVLKNHKESPDDIRAIISELNESGFANRTEPADNPKPEDVWCLVQAGNMFGGAEESDELMIRCFEPHSNPNSFSGMAYSTSYKSEKESGYAGLAELVKQSHDAAKEIFHEKHEEQKKFR